MENELIEFYKLNERNNIEDAMLENNLCVYYYLQTVDVTNITNIITACDAKHKIDSDDICRCNCDAISDFEIVSNRSDLQLYMFLSTSCSDKIQITKQSFTRVSPINLSSNSHIYLAVYDTNGNIVTSQITIKFNVIKYSHNLKQKYLDINTARLFFIQTSEPSTLQSLVWQTSEPIWDFVKKLL